ncbi:MAG: hypothetical protein AAF400_02065 [Bacteroidota bacterium]
MIEKIIRLEAVSPVDFLGRENKNLSEVAACFPSAKIILDGNEIKVQGSTQAVNKIHDILQKLLAHYP